MYRGTTVMWGKKIGKKEIEVCFIIVCTDTCNHVIDLITVYSKKLCDIVIDIYFLCSILFLFFRTFESFLNCVAKCKDVSTTYELRNTYGYIVIFCNGA